MVLGFVLLGATWMVSDSDRLVAQERAGLEPALARMVAEVRALPTLPEIPWQVLPAEWRWAVGAQTEGLNAQLSQFLAQTELARLPHRVLHPDHPLWYRSTVQIEEPVVLDVRADDGAQVWWKGRRIPAEGNQFRLKESGSGELVVRVINKAMWGGLNQVRFAPGRLHDPLMRQAQVREELLSVVREARLLSRRPSALDEAILEAIRSPDSARLARMRSQLTRSPRVLLGPTVQGVTSTRATLVWEVTPGADSHAEYRTDGGAWRKAALTLSKAPARHAKIGGLTPGQLVEYRIVGAEAAQPTFRFRTLPESGPFEFAAWADSQGGWPTFRQNIALMQRLPIAFSVGIGDLVAGASRLGVWHEFFECLTPLGSQVPTMLVGGNHDYGGFYDDLRPVYFERYTTSEPTSQYYAWSAGGSRFVVLDPNEHFPTGIPVGSAQREWFLREVDSPAWREANWRFVFVHQPPHAQGWQGYHGDDLVRELLEPLIEPKRIDFIVCGHTHLYERWIRRVGAQTVHHVIVGGAGGGLGTPPGSAHPVMDRIIYRHHVGHFRVEDRRVSFRAIATDATVLDEFQATR